MLSLVQSAPNVFSGPASVQTTAPAAVSTKAFDADAAVADTKTYLKRLENLGFAGVVLVAEGDRTLLRRGFGLADREPGVRWTPGTISTIGSITKQFTGAAILALSDDGRLKVSDAITKYFPDVPPDKQSITLHHLLTHSSGIVDLEGIGDFDPISRDEFVRRAMQQALAFPPGQGYEYSNAGYSLLGAIIEEITGASYENVRSRALLPAGRHEGHRLYPPKFDMQRLAQGYRAGEKWGTVLEHPMADDGPYWVLRANGGIHSTVEDMNRWAQYLLAGKALTPASMKEYWSPQVDEGGGESFYGYGWVVMDKDGTRIITHNGGNGIHFADLAIVPDTGLVIFVMTNVIAENRSANSLLEQLGMRFLAGRPHSFDTGDRGLGRGGSEGIRRNVSLARRRGIVPHDDGRPGPLHRGGRPEHVRAPQFSPRCRARPPRQAIQDHGGHYRREYEGRFYPALQRLWQGGGPGTPESPLGGPDGGERKSSRPLPALRGPGHGTHRGAWKLSFASVEGYR